MFRRWHTFTGVWFETDSEDSVLANAAEASFSPVDIDLNEIVAINPNEEDALTTIHMSTGIAFMVKASIIEVRSLVRDPRCQPATS